MLSNYTISEAIDRKTSKPQEFTEGSTPIPNQIIIDDAKKQLLPSNDKRNYRKRWTTQFQQEMSEFNNPIAP
jgi:hypothetical protein